MEKDQKETVVCQICKKQKKPNKALPADIVSDSLLESIVKSRPDWSPDGFICLSDLNNLRIDHIRDLIEPNKSERPMPESASTVVNSMKMRELLTTNINAQFEGDLTLGERIADKTAAFGGSWKFIAIFASTMFGWIAINTGLMLSRPFDPYPYILLNLALSCLAAMQAPVIMMSQNRHAAKDRMQAEHDYLINLKAELEIQNLNEKMDYLLTQQWQKLLQIQQIQTDLITERKRKISHSFSKSS